MSAPEGSGRGMLIPLSPDSCLSLLQIIRKSYLSKDYKWEKWKLASASEIYNESLKRQYDDRRREMENSSRTEEELRETFCFTVAIGHKRGYLQKIIDHGLRAQRNEYNAFGNSAKGIYLSRHSDSLLKFAEDFPATKVLSIIVHKVVLGHQLPVTSSDTVPRDPTIGYDCHVSSVAPSADQNAELQVMNTQVYAYEFDGNNVPVARPRQCLPVGVVRFERVKVPSSTKVSLNPSQTSTQNSAAAQNSSAAAQSTSTVVENNPSQATTQIAPSKPESAVQTQRTEQNLSVEKQVNNVRKKTSLQQHVRLQQSIIRLQEEKQKNADAQLRIQRRQQLLQKQLTQEGQQQQDTPLPQQTLQNLQEQLQGQVVLLVPEQQLLSQQQKGLSPAVSESPFQPSTSTPGLKVAGLNISKVIRFPSSLNLASSQSIQSTAPSGSLGTYSVCQGATSAALGSAAASQRARGSPGPQVVSSAVLGTVTVTSQHQSTASQRAPLVYHSHPATQGAPPATQRAVHSTMPQLVPVPGQLVRGMARPTRPKRHPNPTSWSIGNPGGLRLSSQTFNPTRSRSPRLASSVMVQNQSNLPVSSSENSDRVAGTSKTTKCTRIHSSELSFEILDTDFLEIISDNPTATKAILPGLLRKRLRLKLRVPKSIHLCPTPSNRSSDSEPQASTSGESTVMSSASTADANITSTIDKSSPAAASTTRDIPLSATDTALSITDTPLSATNTALSATNTALSVSDTTLSVSDTLLSGIDTTLPVTPIEIKPIEDYEEPTLEVKKEERWEWKRSKKGAPVLVDLTFDDLAEDAKDLPCISEMLTAEGCRSKPKKVPHEYVQVTADGSVEVIQEMVDESELERRRAECNLDLHSCPAYEEDAVSHEREAEVIEGPSASQREDEMVIREPSQVAHDDQGPSEEEVQTGPERTETELASDRTCSPAGQNSLEISHNHSAEVMPSDELPELELAPNVASKNLKIGDEKVKEESTDSPHTDTSQLFCTNFNDNEISTTRVTGEAVEISGSFFPCSDPVVENCTGNLKIGSVASLTNMDDLDFSSIDLTEISQTSDKKQSASEPSFEETVETTGDNPSTSLVTAVDSSASVVSAGSKASTSVVSIQSDKEPVSILSSALDDASTSSKDTQISNRHTSNTNLESINIDESLLQVKEEPQPGTSSEPTSSTDMTDSYNKETNVVTVSSTLPSEENANGATVSSILPYKENGSKSQKKTSKKAKCNPKNPNKARHKQVVKKIHRPQPKPDKMVHGKIRAVSIAEMRQRAALGVQRDITPGLETDRPSFDPRPRPPHFKDNFNTSPQTSLQIGTKDFQRELNDPRLQPVVYLKRIEVPSTVYKKDVIESSKITFSPIKVAKNDGKISSRAALLKRLKKKKSFRPTARKSVTMSALATIPKLAHPSFSTSSDSNAFLSFTTTTLGNSLSNLCSNVEGKDSLMESRTPSAQASVDGAVSASSSTKDIATPNAQASVNDADNATPSTQAPVDDATTATSGTQHADKVAEALTESEEAFQAPVKPPETLSKKKKLGKGKKRKSPKARSKSQGNSRGQIRERSSSPSSRSSFDDYPVVRRGRSLTRAIAALQNESASDASIESSELGLDSVKNSADEKTVTEKKEGQEKDDEMKIEPCFDPQLVRDFEKEYVEQDLMNLKIPGIMDAKSETKTESESTNIVMDEPSPDQVESNASLVEKDTASQNDLSTLPDDHIIQILRAKLKSATNDAQRTLYEAALTPLLKTMVVQKVDDTPAPLPGVSGEKRSDHENIAKEGSSQKEISEVKVEMVQEETINNDPEELNAPDLNVTLDDHDYEDEVIVKAKKQTDEKKHEADLKEEDEDEVIQSLTSVDGLDTLQDERWKILEELNGLEDSSKGKESETKGKSKRKSKTQKKKRKSIEKVNPDEGSFADEAYKLNEKDKHTKIDENVSESEMRDQERDTYREKTRRRKTISHSQDSCSDQERDTCREKLRRRKTISYSQDSSSDNEKNLDKPLKVGSTHGCIAVRKKKKKLKIPKESLDDFLLPDDQSEPEPRTTKSKKKSQVKRHKRCKLVVSSSASETDAYQEIPVKKKRSLYTDSEVIRKQIISRSESVAQTSKQHDGSGTPLETSMPEGSVAQKWLTQMMHIKSQVSSASEDNNELLQRIRNSATAPKDSQPATTVSNNNNIDKPETDAKKQDIPDKGKASKDDGKASSEKVEPKKAKLDWDTYLARRKVKENNEPKVEQRQTSVTGALPSTSREGTREHNPGHTLEVNIKKEELRTILRTVNDSGVKPRPNSPGFMTRDPRALPSAHAIKTKSENTGGEHLIKNLSRVRDYRKGLIQKKEICETKLISRPNEPELIKEIEESEYLIVGMDIDEEIILKAISLRDGVKTFENEQLPEKLLFSDEVKNGFTELNVPLMLVCNLPATVHGKLLTLKADFGAVTEELRRTPVLDITTQRKLKRNLQIVREERHKILVEYCMKERAELMRDIAAKIYRYKNLRTKFESDIRRHERLGHIGHRINALEKHLALCKKMQEMNLPGGESPYGHSTPKAQSLASPDRGRMSPPQPAAAQSPRLSLSPARSSVPPWLQRRRINSQSSDGTPSETEEGKTNVGASPGPHFTGDTANQPDVRLNNPQLPKTETIPPAPDRKDTQEVQSDSDTKHSKSAKEGKVPVKDAELEVKAKKSKSDTIEKLGSHATEFCVESPGEKSSLDEKILHQSDSTAAKANMSSPAHSLNTSKSENIASSEPKAGSSIAGSAGKEKFSVKGKAPKRRKSADENPSKRFKASHKTETKGNSEKKDPNTETKQTSEKKVTKQTSEKKETKQNSDKKETKQNSEKKDPKTETKQNSERKETEQNSEKIDPKNDCNGSKEQKSEQTVNTSKSSLENVSHHKSKSTAESTAKKPQEEKKTSPKGDQHRPKSKAVAKSGKTANIDQTCKITPTEQKKLLSGEMKTIRKGNYHFFCRKGRVVRRPVIFNQTKRTHDKDSKSQRSATSVTSDSKDTTTLESRKEQFRIPKKKPLRSLNKSPLKIKAIPPKSEENASPAPAIPLWLSRKAKALSNWTCSSGQTSTTETVGSIIATQLIQSVKRDMDKSSTEFMQSEKGNLNPSATEPMRPGNRDSNPSATEPIRPVNRDSNPSATEPIRPVNRDSNPSATEPIRPVNRDSNPSATEPIRPVNRDSHPPATEPMRPVSSDSNPSATEPIRPVNRDSNPTATEPVRPVNRDSIRSVRDPRLTRHDPVSPVDITPPWQTDQAKKWRKEQTVLLLERDQKTAKSRNEQSEYQPPETLPSAVGIPPDACHTVMSEDVNNDQQNESQGTGEQNVADGSIETTANITDTSCVYSEDNPPERSEQDTTDDAWSQFLKGKASEPRSVPERRQYRASSRGHGSKDSQVSHAPWLRGRQSRSPLRRNARSRSPPPSRDWHRDSSRESRSRPRRGSGRFRTNNSRRRPSRPRSPMNYRVTTEAPWSRQSASHTDSYSYNPHEYRRSRSRSPDPSQTSRHSGSSYHYQDRHYPDEREQDRYPPDDQATHHTMEGDGNNNRRRFDFHDPTDESLPVSERQKYYVDQLSNVNHGTYIHRHVQRHRNREQMENIHSNDEELLRHLQMQREMNDRMMHQQPSDSYDN